MVAHLLPLIISGAQLGVFGGVFLRGRKQKKKGCYLVICISLCPSSLLSMRHKNLQVRRDVQQKTGGWYIRSTINSWNPKDAYPARANPATGEFHFSSHSSLLDAERSCGKSQNFSQRGKDQTNNPAIKMQQILLPGLFLFLWHQFQMEIHAWKDPTGLKIPLKIRDGPHFCAVCDYFCNRFSFPQPGMGLSPGHSAMSLCISPTSSGSFLQEINWLWCLCK